MPLGKGWSGKTTTKARPAPTPVRRSLTAQTSQGRPPATKVVGPPVVKANTRPLASKATASRAFANTQSPAAKSAGIVKAAQNVKTAAGIANLARNAKPAAKMSVANAAAKAASGGYAANTKPAAKVSLARALTNATGGGYNTPTGGGTTTPGGGGRGGGTTTPTTPTTPTAPTPPPAPAPPTVAGPGPLNTSGESFTRAGGGTAGQFDRLRKNRGPRSSLSITPEMLQRIAAQRIVNRG